MDATGFSIEDKTKQPNSLAETSSLVVSLFIFAPNSAALWNHLP